MKNPLKAIKTVALAVWAPRGDSTPITLTPDFTEMNLKNLDLSPEAKKVLLAGRNDADDFQRSFESVAAKQSQPVVQSRVKSRATQSQIPSKYRAVSNTRTSIVTGETSREEPDDDKGPERTLGPKY